MTDTKKTVVVVGGGAAGFFGAITAASLLKDCHVILLEKTRQLLTKVKISGGGRCNVTHSCFEPSALVKNYPRGGKELLGPFTRFQPRDMIEWLQARGVKLKVEPDGRMFPITDSSETIIKCLMEQAKALGVEIRLGTGVIDVVANQKFELKLTDGETLSCNCLLVATGGVSKSHTQQRDAWLERLGHTLHPPVPSLFTFNTPDSPLLSLAGISVPKAKVSIMGSSLVQTGPLLITHWGFSGPAVLKLSAWGARVLAEKGYKAEVKIDFLPELTIEEVKRGFSDCKALHPNRLVSGESPVELPKNLWKKFVELSQVKPETRWAALSKAQMNDLIKNIKESLFQIDGKSTNKEEFVTCGGINLQEVNFKTMESRLIPGLYFAGEVLDIDGVTGGFNFQNAWTTAYIAAHAIADKIKSSSEGV